MSTIAPQALNVTMVSMMPTLFGSMASQNNSNYMIDNNAMYTMAWDTSCVLDPSLASGENNVSCTKNPTFF
jgi:hypothetical protein